MALVLFSYDFFHFLSLFGDISIRPSFPNHFRYRCKLNKQFIKENVQGRHVKNISTQDLLTMSLKRKCQCTRSSVSLSVHEIIFKTLSFYTQLFYLDIIFVCYMKILFMYLKFIHRIWQMCSKYG